MRLNPCRLRCPDCMKLFDLGTLCQCRVRDPRRCAKVVHGRASSHQCANRAAVGSYCRIHDPREQDARRARRPTMAQREADQAEEQRRIEARIRRLLAALESDEARELLLRWGGGLD